MHTLVMITVGSLASASPALAQGLVYHTDAAGFAGVRCGGGCAGDFNGDGLQDLAIGSNGVRLFLNRGDRTFTETTASWGLTGGAPTSGPSEAVGAADYDGDGLLDLAWAPSNRVFTLYRNTGSGFEDVTEAAGVAMPMLPGAYGAGGIAWGDADLDGDLDLAVTAWSGSRVFLNKGDGSFTDITDTIPAPYTQVPAFSPRWVDLDGDRLPELVIISDFRRSIYYANLGAGRFENITEESVTNLDGTEMGFTVGDYDLDGVFDFYVTTIGSNNLYLNEGSNVFREIGDAAGVASSDWGWAATTLDLDHDGRPDLAATDWNFGRQPLFLNSGTRPNGDPVFTDIRSREETPAHRGWGLARFDLENDGDQDLAYFAQDDFVIAENRLAAGNWLRIFLDTTGYAAIAPNGIGSVIRIRIGDSWRIGRIDGGSNFQSQSELSAHFGLGDASVIDEIEVRWTDGTRTAIGETTANQTLTIRPTGCAADLDGDGSADIVDLLVFVDGWLNGAQDFNNDGETSIVDLLEFVESWLACR